MTHETIFRFAVGKKDGPKSSVWNASWTNNDLYLMARDLMGNRKISLHKSGCRAYAFLCDNTANAARQQSGYPGETRRICEWRQPSREVAPGVVHELSIIVPTDDLSTGNLWPDSTTIIPIPAACVGMATEIDICMPANAGSTAHPPIPNSYLIGPGYLSYQHIAIEDGLENSIKIFRNMIAGCIQPQQIASPASYRVISEPVPLVGNAGDGPRVIYELSVERTLNHPA